MVANTFNLMAFEDGWKLAKTGAPLSQNVLRIAESDEKSACAALCFGYRLYGQRVALGL